MPPKTIGSLNGNWAALFKLCLVLAPLLWGCLTGAVSWGFNRIEEQGMEIARLRENKLEITRRLDSIDSGIMEINRHLMNGGKP